MSGSFDWKTEARRRLRLRAEAALAVGRTGVFLEDEVPPDLEACALIQCVRAAGVAPIPGFEKIASRSFRRPEPLYEMLARFSPALGRAFAPGGAFHHVGGRICLRRADGLCEETWLRIGSGLEKEARLGKASTLALAWITVGGIGFLPVVGATLASLVTALAAYGAGWLWEWESVRLGALGVVVVTTLASVLVERAAARHFLSDDAREFVLDEVAGMALTLAFVPAAGWPWGVALAFCAFRFFDVLKPGIDWVEECNWRGTIVWDDLLAGLYAGIVTAVIGAGGIWLAR